MLSAIGLVLVAVIAVIVILAVMKPDSFTVERRASINAPPDRVFPLIDSFRRWVDWSPWEKLDPAMRKDFGGPDSGVGSSYAWEGNKKAGQGRMEITESTPPSEVRLKLDFLKPFKSSNTTVFELAPTAAGTDVRWVMYGPANFITKVMMVFTTMDKMVGKDFEEGLDNLKRLAERPAVTDGASVGVDGRASPPSNA